MNQKVNFFNQNNLYFPKFKQIEAFPRPNKHENNYKTDEKLAQICIILISQCLLHDIKNLFLLLFCLKCFS